jgi:hypothetical protein
VFICAFIELYGHAGYLLIGLRPRDPHRSVYEIELHWSECRQLCRKRIRPDRRLDRIGRQGSNTIFVRSTPVNR